jgi:F420-dependent oxidoreductase-like protein
MKIGIFHFGKPEVEAHVQAAVDAESDGFDSYWYPQIFGAEVMTVIALAGQRTSRIEFGTSVIPVYTRHPTIMALQALTTQAATGGRFNLGLGLSHAPVVQAMWGLSYARPAVYMREYLSVLQPLLEQGSVSFDGEMFHVRASAEVPAPQPPPVLIAALAPVMLKTAGERTAGTITWMTGKKTLATHIVPRISRAAATAGRTRPRIVCALPLAVADDPDEARQRAAANFAVYGGLPNYQRVLNIEGATGPRDVVVVGNEKQVEQELREFADAGATDFLAALFPVGSGDARASLARTRELLKSVVGKI